jgi:hypothetical protein
VFCRPETSSHALGMLVGPHASRGFRARESARQRRAYQRRGVFQAFNLTILVVARPA